MQRNVLRPFGPVPLVTEGSLALGAVPVGPPVAMPAGRATEQSLSTRAAFFAPPTPEEQR
jgi:hypothetical protein